MLLARRRNAGPIDSVKSGAPSDGPATPGPGSTVKQPFLAAATSAGDIRGRHLGDVLEEPHAETPEDQPTGSLVYGPVSQTPSPPQTPEKPSALKEDSEAGTKAEEQPSVRDRVPSNWEEVAWGKNKPPAAAEPPLQQAPGAAAPGPGPAAAAESSEEGQGRRSVARLAEDPLDVMEASLVGAGTLARRGAPERVSMYAPRVRAADGGAFGRRLGTPPQSMYSMALHARLERVWSILRMPASVKATMAEKYARSGSPWASRFEEAVMVWETGASAVLERERALAEFASLTQELVSAAAAGGRVKHSAAEAMESVCARLLYAHQLCIDIAALLEDTFDESFSLAGQPYPPEAEKITPDGLRQVVEYAWALCEGDDPDDAREDTPQGHAEIGSEAAQPRLPPLHGSGASRGGLGTSGAEMRGGSGGGPERRAVELRGGSRGADILRLEDAAEVTSVEAHHLPPVQAR